MKPPKRERKSKTNHSASSLRCSWTRAEKRGLLAGLKMYSKEQLKEIQKFVPTKSVDEVKWYMEKVESVFRRGYSGNGIGSKDDINEAEKKAPIQLWTHLASDLVSEDVDYSHLVTEVMNISATLEPHDKNRTASDPDFPAIYQYLVALLKGFDPPDLRAIDSAIILDLMQGLADELQGFDITNQEKLMKAKYKLLSVKLDVNNKELVYECARRAMEDDLLENEEAQKVPKEFPVNISSGPSTSTDTAPQASCSNSNSQDATPTRLGRPHSAAKLRAQSSLHKKGVLHTLNPFCIPIKYLQPAPKQKAQSSKDK